MDESNIYFKEEFFPGNSSFEESLFPLFSNDFPELNETAEKCTQILSFKEGKIKGNTVDDRASWPGEYIFKCNINEGKGWLHVNDPPKLFVNINTPVSFTFKTVSKMPIDCLIRAVVGYARPLKPQEVVRCCPNHSTSMLQTGMYESFESHFVKCESSAAAYATDSETGENSVCVPYENPQDGSENSSYLFKFMCLSSCAGGADRRPLCVIFTLELKLVESF
ncbi:Tumor protein 63 [Nymphon striatum]|nr:Tumor protein 63 [Nymphon striatum]